MQSALNGLFVNLVAINVMSRLRRQSELYNFSYELILV